MQILPGLGSNSWVISGRFTKSGKPLLANDPHLNLSDPNIWYLTELTAPNLHVMGASIFYNNTYILCFFKFC